MTAGFATSTRSFSTITLQARVMLGSTRIFWLAGGQDALRISERIQSDSRVEKIRSINN